MTQRQPTSRTCFVCGRENPIGLRIHWDQDVEKQEIRGAVTLPDHFNGYPGVAHGGIVSAVLDETAGRSILIDGGFDDLMVTAKLEVLFRRPTPTGVPLTVVGRLLRRSESRAETEAELLLPDGTVAARASVLLARPPAQITARWAAEREHWRVDE
jgi:acyl-coenzyme A thioesterase PaaI-like protein